MTPLRLPVVSLERKALLEGEGESICADAEIQDSVKSACHAYGMFHVSVGQDVMEIVSSAFRAVDDFFALPSCLKESVCPLKPSPACARGYLGPGSESGGPCRELKEAFSCGFPFSLAEQSQVQWNELQAPNVWPSTCSGINCAKFKQSLESLFVVLSRVALALSRVIASFLHEEDVVEIAQKGVHVSLLRCFHYLPLMEDAADGTRDTGSSPHTDWGFCTVIAQRPPFDDSYALQLFHEGAWRAIESVPNTLLINCGDYLHLRTNGAVQSPLHRVQLTAKERTSFVYFHYPDYDSRIPGEREKVARFRHLSLLKDQAAGRERDAADIEDGALSANMAFGKFVALKWQQVSRTEN